MRTNKEASTETDAVGVGQEGNDECCISSQSRTTQENRYICIYEIVGSVFMVRVPYGTHRWNTYSLLL